MRSLSRPSRRAIGLGRSHADITARWVTATGQIEGRVRLDVGAVACGVMAALIFGGGAVVSRHLVSADGSPVDLVVARYLGAFPAALVLWAMRGPRLLAGLTPLRLMVVLLLAGPPYHLLLLSAYGGATSGAGALIIGGLVPILTSALASPCRDFWSSPTVAAWALIIGGLSILGLAAHATCTPASALLFAVAAAMWAGLNVVVARWRLDPLALTAVLALSAPLFLPLYLASGIPAGGIQGGALLLQIGYHGLLVGWLATLLIVTCARRGGARTASACVALIPSCALVLGAVWLGEPLGVPQVAAVLLVMTGVLLSSHGGRQPSSKAGQTRL